MTFVVTKIIKGNPYLYIVRSEREGDKVHQRFVKYLGRRERFSQADIDAEIAEANEIWGTEREYEREPIAVPEPSVVASEPQVSEVSPEATTVVEVIPEVKEKEIWKLPATSKEYSELSIDELDKAAFGFSRDEITQLNPEQLEIKWQDDYDNAVYQQENSGLSKEEWAKSVNLEEPIDVIYEDGQFKIDDGYHRFYAASILNEPLNVSLNIIDKPHRTIVEKALSEGKEVPKEVLKDYPDLTPAVAEVKPQETVEVIEPAPVPSVVSEPEPEEPELEVPEEVKSAITKEYGSEKLFDRLELPVRKITKNFGVTRYSFDIKSKPNESVESVQITTFNRDKNVYYDSDIVNVTPTEDPYEGNMYGGNIEITDDRYKFSNEFEPLNVEEQSEEYLWRGMSGEEWEKALYEGYWSSAGAFNLGEEQEGATYFSTNPRQATNYAGGFAPFQFMPTWDKPGVIVRMKRPPEDQLVLMEHIPSEIGVKGDIWIGDIDKVYELRLAEETPGVLDIVVDDYRPYDPPRQGTRASQSQRYVAREVPKEEWEDFIYTKERPVEELAVVSEPETSEYSGKYYRTEIEPSKSGVVFYSKNRDYVEELQGLRGKGQITEADIQLRNPLVINATTKQFADPSFEKQYIDKAIAEGNDAVVFVDKENDDVFVARVPSVQGVSESVTTPEQLNILRQEWYSTESGKRYLELEATFPKTIAESKEYQKLTKVFNEIGMTKAEKIAWRKEGQRLEAIDRETEREAELDEEDFIQEPPEYMRGGTLAQPEEISPEPLDKIHPSIYTVGGEGEEMIETKPPEEKQEKKTAGLHCVNCGKRITRPYYYKGEPYGIECWKNIALPQIEAEREEKFKEQDREDYLRSHTDIEVLKLKDMSKITSNFKREFIPSVIKQFEEKGFLTAKQRSIISDMYNNKDWKNYWRIAVEAGLQDKQNLIDNGLMEEKDFGELLAKKPSVPSESVEVKPTQPQTESLITPNMPISYVQAKKRPDGKWQLFFTGTRNEVFPNELFDSSADAKMAFKVAQARMIGTSPSEVKPTEPQIIKYEPDLDIRNTEALSRGTGAKYMIAIQGQGDELIAKKWARKIPQKLEPNEVLIDMKPPEKLSDTYEIEDESISYNRYYGLNAVPTQWETRRVRLPRYGDDNIVVYRTKSGWLTSKVIDVKSGGGFMTMPGGEQLGSPAYRERAGAGGYGFGSPDEAIKAYIEQYPPQT